MSRKLLTGFFAACLLATTGLKGAVYAKPASPLPRFINMQYTIAMCKGKPIGFWEYRYTIFSSAADLNFKETMTVKNMHIRVTHGVYEFYKSHPKEVAASLFTKGQSQLYDLVQVHVPVIKKPKWHQWYRVDLSGSQSPVPVSAPASGDSDSGGSQTCPAGTVSCANG